MVDYDGKIACTVFTGGCNLRCPFCHNASLVKNEIAETFPTEEIIAFLKKRVGLLDGVCLTGGEPLLNSDAADFLAEVKSLGYSVKLDTNGTFPERLKEIVSEKLVDYVAMDVKNTFEKYPETVGISGFKVENVKKSIEFFKI